MQRRDPIRPVAAAATCAFMYWVLLNVLIPPVRFLGGEMTAITVAQLLAASIAAALAMAIFESRSLADLGLDWREGAGRNLATGLLLGIGGAALVVIPPLVTGMAHFESLPEADISWRAAGFTPLLLFCGAAGEEIAFRGFTLQSLMRGYGAWAAILVMGAIFGLMHSQNPGSTALSVANTAAFGVLFGASLLRAHDLWLPIGIHFGWNATLPFLGVGLSGLTIRITRYQLVWTAGELWSGGRYGPENSLLASIVLIVLFVAVWKVPVSKGRAYLLESPPD